MRPEIDGFIEATTPWVLGALVLVIVLLFIGALTDFGRQFRRPAKWSDMWPFERSFGLRKDAIERALLQSVKAERPFVPVSGLSQAIVRARQDDGPLTVDSVLLSPGEVAVFDASGALVVWFPAPGSDVGSVVCQKSITILTYADMPQATSKMRDQLRLLKGGRDG